jgi:hypothetical protein
MSMSDYEKNILDDIERSLTTDEPTLASALRAHHSRFPPRLSRICYPVATLAGVVLVFLGVQLNSGAGTAVAVVGYLAVVGGVNGIISALRGLGRGPRFDRQRHSTPPR